MHQIELNQICKEIKMSTDAKGFIHIGYVMKILRDYVVKEEDL